MDPVVGRIVLVIYAALVGAGGVMGFLKAKSRPSLIAGLASAALAMVALGVTFADPMVGFGLGAVLSALLLAMFAARYAKGRKFMPGGMMVLVSAATLALLIAQLLTLRGPSPGIPQIGAEPSARPGVESR